MGVQQRLYAMRDSPWWSRDATIRRCRGAAGMSPSAFPESEQIIMPLSMYQASIPVFVRALNVLTALLDKAEAHAAQNGIALNTLVEARLAPDMYPLSGQIQRASDASKFAIKRLTGLDAPSFEDVETTFPELRKRIADTVAWLQSVPASAVDGSETRTVQLSFGEFKASFQGDSYLLTFALPNFYFHITTAYAILRHKGVPVGKLDFLGPYPA